MLHKWGLSFLKLFYVAVLKIMTSQWPSTITIAFVSPEKLHQTVTVTFNTKMQQQLLITAITIIVTLKIIFVILCHRQLLQTRSMMGLLHCHWGIPRWSVTMQCSRNLQLTNYCFKVIFFLEVRYLLTTKLFLNFGTKFWL